MQNRKMKSSTAVRAQLSPLALAVALALPAGAAFADTIVGNQNAVGVGATAPGAVIVDNGDGTTTTIPPEFNVVYGVDAGNGATGSQNTGVGDDALWGTAGNGNTATGYWSANFVTGDYNTSNGYYAGWDTNGNSNVAVGDHAGNYVTGSNNVAIGTYAGSSITANNSVAIGTGASAATNSVAIGAGATASHANSVALGSGSVTTSSNSVSVGAVGAERKIQNVAAGTLATDAVNLGQMQAADAAVLSGANAYTDAGLAINSANDRAYASAVAAQAELDANAYTDAAVGTSTAYLEGQIGELREEAFQGIAAAAAIVPMAPAGKGETTVNVGAATYGGQGALGLAAAHQISNRINLNAGVGLTGGRTLGRVGVGFRF